MVAITNLRRRLVDWADVVAIGREIPHLTDALANNGAAVSHLTAADLLAAQVGAAEGGPAVLVVRADPDPAQAARVVWANAAALSLLGQSIDDKLQLRTVGSMAGGLPQPNNWLAVVTKLIAAGGPESDDWFSATLDAPDAPDAVVRVRIRPVAVSGTPGQFLVWMRPSSDELQIAEQAVEEAEFRFRALGENAPIGIIVSDLGLRLGFANNGLAAIVGVERSALLGTGWLAAVDPDDLSGLLDILEDVLGGMAAESTLRLIPTTGAPRWVHLRLAPVTTHRRAAGFVGTIEDITARRDWESQLSYQATHDTLTGLANRRQLVGALSDMFASRRMADRHGAVLFCDVDGFKSINDTFGHDAGDRVLIEMARRMSATARDGDLIARMAGDEFVILLRHTDTRADAEAAAARQLAALRGVIHVGTDDVHLSASIGIAMLNEYGSASTLLHGADAAMYAAKRAGQGLARYSRDGDARKGGPRGTREGGTREGDAKESDTKERDTRERDTRESDTHERDSGAQ